MKKTNVFHTTFPIISEVIDIELLRNDSIHRDMIISKLLDRSEIQALLPSLLEKNTKHNTPQKAIGNMVDWFSAEITKKKSNISIAYSNKYTRRKIKNNERKVWGKGVRVNLGCGGLGGTRWVCVALKGRPTECAVHQVL